MGGFRLIRENAFVDEQRAVEIRATSLMRAFWQRRRVGSALPRAPYPRASDPVSVRSTLAPVVLAAATGRFALLHRVVAVTAAKSSSASSPSLKGLLPVSRVTSSNARGSSNKAHHGWSVNSSGHNESLVVLSHANAKRKGVVCAAGTFRAFALDVSGTAGGAKAASTDRKETNKKTMTPATTRVIVWFRNDLRLGDNYVVQKALNLCASDGNVEVLPLFVFDPRQFATSKWGSPKTGGHRGRFLHQAVADLRLNLKAINSDLLVQVGHPEDIIAELTLGGGKTTIVLTQVRVLRVCVRG